MKQLIFLISALLLLQLVTSRFVEQELEEDERKALEKRRWVRPAAKYASKWAKEAVKAGLQSEAYNYAKNKAKQAYNWGRDKVRKWGRKRYIGDLDELNDVELADLFKSQLQ